jgi:uncharacterized protein (TIGR00296 family)
MPSLFEARPSGAGRSLNAAEQQALLQYARQGIIETVCSGDLPRVLRNDGVFAERRGVFVTLHVLGRLRGCIGVVETPGDATEPAQAIEHLGSSVIRCATSAALADPRFPPLRQEELSALQIEISLLSSPQPIRPEQIEIGRHGLLVVSAPSDRQDASPHPFATNPSSDRESRLSHARPAGASPSASKAGPFVKRGLLLPQVAVEHKFTVEEFLTETCRKAGLPADAWRSLPAASRPAAPLNSSLPEAGPSASAGPAAEGCYIQLFAFTCQVFSEADATIQN